MPADFQSFVVMILLSSWEIIERLWLYVIGGVFLGALVGTFLPRERSFDFLKGRRSLFLLPVASLVGMVSPACTLGTVPVFAEAVKRGASIGPAVSFLVASSLINPQMSVLAAGALGFHFLVLQVLVALVAAVLIGAAAHAAARRGIPIASPAVKERDGHQEHHKHHKHSKRRSGFKGFIARFIDLFEFVGFYFLIGTLLAMILSYTLNFSVVMRLLGEGKWYAVPLGALISVPAYVCGGGMIPFLAEAKNQGMHSGAILAFLIAGPATRITSLAALAVLIRKRYVAAYVLFIVLLASAAGLLFTR